MIKEIRFIGSDGKPIESSKTSSGSMGVFGKKTYSATYSLKKAVDEVVIEVEVYTDLKKINIPFDLNIGAK